MNTKQKFIVTLVVIVVVIIACLGMIKLLPFWQTMLLLVSFVAGMIAGYCLRKYKELLQ